MIPVLTKISLVGLLFLCFSFQGISDEKIYGTEYTATNASGEEVKFRYKEPMLNVYVVSLLSVLISGSILMMINLKNQLLSFKDKLILGVLYSIGKYSCESSFKYVDYITKTIAKSSKSLVCKFYL